MFTSKVDDAKRCLYDNTILRQFPSVKKTNTGLSMKDVDRFGLRHLSDIKQMQLLELQFLDVKIEDNSNYGSPITEFLRNKT